MPVIEPFPEKQNAAETPTPDTLPEGIISLATREGLVLVARQTVCLSSPEHKSRARQIRFAPDAFHALLDILEPHEELCLAIDSNDHQARPTIKFTLQTSGANVEEALSRREGMSLALDTALDMAMPDFTIIPSKAKKNELPYHVPLVPQGVSLPLIHNDPSRDKPGPDLVSYRKSPLASKQEICFSTFPNNATTLPMLMRMLARHKGRVELLVILCRRSLDAPLLRRLYAARTTLQAQSVTDFLKKSVLPFDEMGGHDILTSLMRDGTAFEVQASIHADQPIDNSFLSMMCQNLFGSSLATNTRPPELDLRTLYPLSTFRKKLLPVLLAFAPAAAVVQKIDHLLPQKGVLLGKTDKSTDLRLTERDRARHTYIIGSTGTGKSTLLANMIKQDIEEGKGVILFDPHGDLWQQVRESVPAERQKDLILAHLGNTEQPFTMNILAGQGGDPAIERNTITNSLIDLFKRVLYQNVPEAFGPMFELYFRNALLLLMTAHGDKATIMDFERIFDDTRYDFDEGEEEQVVNNDHDDDDIPFNPFADLPPLPVLGAPEQGRRRNSKKITFRRHLLEKCSDERVKAFWAMAENVDYNEIAIKNVAPYIVCKLTQITGSPLLAPVLGARESTLDFQKVISEKKICLINLAKGTVGSKDAAFAGGLMSIRLAMAAQAQARLPENERHQVNVYMDEFQTYATDLLPEMMAEVRKYGLNMVLANQTLSQIDGRGFKADAAGGILGNVANLISFRVGIPDADLLARWLAPHFSAEDLAQLPDYSAATRLLAKGQPLPSMILKTLPPY